MAGIGSRFTPGFVKAWRAEKQIKLNTKAHTFGTELGMQPEIAYDNNLSTGKTVNRTHRSAEAVAAVVTLPYYLEYKGLVKLGKMRKEARTDRALREKSPEDAHYLAVSTGSRRSEKSAEKYTDSINTRAQSVLSPLQDNRAKLALEAIVDKPDMVKVAQRSGKKTQSYKAVASSLIKNAQKGDRSAQRLLNTVG
jgi:hypothetical protein